MALYPAQDAFTRGEISPRLHARASLDLYRAGLSKCVNWITLPHGGLRKRGGTEFVAEVKNSIAYTRLIQFIFSSEQAYALEVGDLYIRVYAYGARVGSFEVVTPYVTADLKKLQFVQSADQMWILHPDYVPRVLTRTDHTTWTLEEFEFEDGPYGEVNQTTTTLTPGDTASLTPNMTTNTTPSGTVSSDTGSADAYKLFNGEKVENITLSAAGAGWLQYQLPGGAQKIVDAYWITASDRATDFYDYFTSWVIEGSNNGIAWTTLDTRTGEIGWQNSETRFYEFTNGTAYEYYRIVYSGGGGDDANNTVAAEIRFHVAAASQTPMTLTASSTTGINFDFGFQLADVGRSIRIMGSDGMWRWFEVTGYTSNLIVTGVLHGHALPNTSPITRWRLGTFVPGAYVESGSLFEERLAFSRRFSVYASATSDFDNFAQGEEDDDALEFLNAGGGEANDIVWLAEADGALLIGTSGGVRALSGSGLDEALTPSSFKNRRSRTFGCARIRPVDAGQSFIYVTRSRKALAELSQSATGRFTSEDVGQISEHIPKRGIVEIAFQTDPDPLLWFPLETGEVGTYTHQPSQEVRGMHRQQIAGTFDGSSWGIVESCIVTPGQDGTDTVWMIVLRTVNGFTRRYIEIKTTPFEYLDIEDAFEVDCGLTYEGSAVTAVSGMDHLAGATVDVLAGNRVYRGLTVSAAGVVTLPSGSPAATKWVVGLPYSSEADTLELDVGGRDGSLMGRRKKVHKLIMSLFETDLSGLEVRSKIRGEWKDEWEPVEKTTIVPADGTVSLFTGNIQVAIDDSWEGQGQVQIRHRGPTPCTIRAVTPVFTPEP